MSGQLETADRSDDADQTMQLLMNDAEGQYLTFHLADEIYGIEILRVHEIKGWLPVTRVPNTPEYMRGVLNLRGTIVPIIDVRQRFNLETKPYGKTTVVIVATVRFGDRNKVMGMVVDGVSDVLNVQADEVRQAPAFETAVDADFISGLVTVDEQMVMLLDIDRLLGQAIVDKLPATH